MTSKYTPQQVVDIATEIRNQINVATLMSLGATEIRPASPMGDDRPGLAFIARILPFNSTGRRAARPRRMRVFILLDPSDTYSVAITHSHASRTVTHLKRSGIHADQLNRMLLALDYDGPEALNPRLY